MAAAGDHSSPRYAGAGSGYSERSLPTAWHSDICQHLPLYLSQNTPTAFDLEVNAFLVFVFFFNLPNLN